MGVVTGGLRAAGGIVSGTTFSAARGSNVTAERYVGVDLSSAAQPAASPHAAAVDKVFARWSDSTPGCAVAVSENDKPALSKAYGMSDLERGVRNTPDTIFEAGSVSKQFTAAAVLLLARDGKLSLDDPVRKYIPELPDYGAPLTIRHMLNHTSGLRDWGSVAGIAGWPRTTRAYSHGHVLDIISHQRKLNFPSGTRYSYSNSGFNLAAILVSRVSGKTFADFTQERLFKPLGMSHTSWRDDYRRIVKNRALAYGDNAGSYETVMPFENVHGNGGLLTTVGDLLTWNRNFSSHVVGDAAFIRELETPGRFNDGRQHGYALGLMVGTRYGLREVAHSGSTAGYTAHLTRFPEQAVSVAVLCNASTGGATQAANAVAAIFLGDRARRNAVTSNYTLTAADVQRVTGAYRSRLSGEMMNLVPDARGVRIERGTQFVAESGTRFTAENGDVLHVDAGGLRIVDRFGSEESFERTAVAQPSAAELASLTGTYVSEEAELTLTVAVEDGSLVLKRRPDTTIRLTPLYKDAFRGSIGTVIFRRGANVELSVVQDRVWDLRFQRRPSSSGTAR
jgi:CubicO group peptidase (beta-lactamase class C family)